LKKSSKKLLSVSDSVEFASSDSVPAAMDEGFLLLFFKKEGLCFPYSSGVTQTIGNHRRHAALRRIKLQPTELNKIPRTGEGLHGGVAGPS